MMNNKNRTFGGACAHVGLDQTDLLNKDWVWEWSGDQKIKVNVNLQEIDPNKLKRNEILLQTTKDYAVITF